MKTITTAEMSEIMLNAFYTISESKVDISGNRICPQSDNANCVQTRTQTFQIRGDSRPRNSPRGELKRRKGDTRKIWNLPMTFFDHE